MAVRDYIINRSNYTLKKKRQETAKGSVYERDFMTTTDPSSWISDVFSYNEGNFKMTSRVSENARRKHQFGGWLKSGCEDGAETSSDVWSLSCMGQATSITDEGKITLKPNYSSFLDFAYYGSLTDLLETTVSYVADNFPAELTITDEIPQYWDTEEEITRNIGYNFSAEMENIREVWEDKITDTNYKAYGAVSALTEISNPYEIDVRTKEINTINDSNINQLRYMCLSSQLYAVVKSGEITDDEQMYACACNWECLYKKKGCYNGDLTAIVTINNSFKGNEETPTQLIFFEFYNEGKYVLMTHKSYVGYSLRPYNKVKKLKYINEFYDGLNDFGKMLLDRYSDPIYTCFIDVPKETEYGIVKSKSNFTWPTIYDYNIDIFTGGYEYYMNQLLAIATFYDEGYTDNLWNRMTHDAIKNMDSTFVRQHSDDTTDDYELGRTKIHQLIKLYGRFFDNIKLYARNIKQTNVITYNGYNNIPDYFLTDTLDISGWDVYSPTNGMDIPVSGITVDDRKWTSSDINTEFMRRLRINSKDILSHKGTKLGIEKILGLFGLRSYDYAKALIDNIPATTSSVTEDMYEYKISEYVSVASGGEKVDSTEDMMDVERYNMLKVGFDGEDDTLQGLPCVMVDNGTVKYIVPWYTTPDELDGHPYFQMYGGWGRMYKKTVEYVDPLSGTTNLLNSEILYDETLKYIHVVNKVADLTEIPFSKIYDKCVCYVFDTSDYEDYYGTEFTEDNTHYFYLKDSNNFGIHGTDVDTGRVGWENVSVAQIESPTADGKDCGARILYLESLIDDYKGNNPHVGYGQYDFGQEYLDYFKHLFKYALENSGFTDDAYDCSDGEINKSISGIGFNLTEYVDSEKVWYFYDDENSIWYKKETTKDGNDYTADEDEQYDTEDEIDSFYESKLKPYDFETETSGNRRTEPAALSVINEKRMTLSFEGTYTNSEGFRNYFYKSINPYIKQMIPSSTIFEVRFKSLSDADYTISTSRGYAVGLTESSEILVERHSDK